MKKNIKNVLILAIGFILGLGVAVCAAVIASAKDVEFTPTDSEWNVSNVEDAINDLQNNYYSSDVVDNLVTALGSWNFDYTGNYQTFTAPLSGTYKIETWGASGGNGCGGLSSNSSYYCNNGATGGYASGEISLVANEKLYIYVGGTAYNNTDTTTTYTAGGWNGGGSGMIAPDKDERGTGGGGATDIRLVSGSWNDSSSLKSRIMVAGGGGGSVIQGASFKTITSGYGGGLSGVGTIYAYSGVALGTSANGTQTSGYAFGYGEDGYSTGDSEGAAGAGGGYYGGRNGKSMTSNTSYYGSGAGGGSGFVSGYEGCNAIDENGNHTGQSIHYSGKSFTNASLIAGNASMPTHDGSSTMTGNSGNGYAKITLVSLD